MSISNARACGLIWPGDQPSSMVSENALVVWNADRHREHLIRSVKFQANGQALGFIVPVPSLPDVADSNSHVFQDLEAELERQRPVEYKFFFNKQEPVGASFGSKGLDSAAVPGSAGVSVVRTFTLEDFDVKVLKADSLEPLELWLTENTFKMRPALKLWLDNYLSQKWYFVVFKFRNTSHNQEFESKNVRISFAAQAPIYPYRDSQDTIPDPQRLLRLYFISDEPYSTDWPPAQAPETSATILRFSNIVDVKSDITEMNLAKNLWLKTWDDSTKIRPDRDLVFKKDKVKIKTLLKAEIREPVELEIAVVLLLVIGIFIYAALGVKRFFKFLTRKIRSS